ncbi:MAG: YebC/PmpR family DNA-binding transcriptional regulator [Elusimicrobiales bacterium]|nr:YebC/PmpR family DNA-binding transcriptional regulator [Elusimicrobiales bacterium]
MGGHSHWAGIKHKKAANDAKKSKIFTKLIKEITIAAKLGGGEPEKNPRLRKAIEDAKEVNMPMDNIKRAIMRGTGQIPGASYEEVVYEGYGPGGIAVMIEATTDNKNRTFNELRVILERHGGNMGTNGCVSWIFERKGFITINKGTVQEEKMFDIAVDCGAEDIKVEGDIYEITTPVENFENVINNLKLKGINISSSEITMLPKNTVNVTDEEKASTIIKMMDELENHDDVKNIYSNFDIPSELMDKLMK